MVPVKTNSNWLPSIFNDFFENEWLAKTGVTAPAINVIENDKDYKVEKGLPDSSFPCRTCTTSVAVFAF